MKQKHKGIDPNKIWSWFTPEKRRAYYLLLTALSAILVAWGILDQEVASQWLGIAGMILVGGTAASHAQRFDPEEYQRKTEHEQAFGASRKELRKAHANSENPTALEEVEDTTE